MDLSFDIAGSPPTSVNPQMDSLQPSSNHGNQPQWLSSIHPHASANSVMQQYRQAGMMLSVAQNQNRFIEDLLSAESSLNALERYKALIRLMSALKRRMLQANIVNPLNPQSWEGPEQQEVLKQIVMVGECLARFGTAEFSERSNASRAINTKDYATLLTQFLEAHGTLFALEFILSLPQGLQDEVLTVRTLLQTRCEANSILFGQLVKHVGLEGQGNGVVVCNTNVVSSNPTSTSSASPKTLTQVAAQAWSKATEKRSSRFGLMGAAALLGLWMLKGRLGWGGSRQEPGRRRVCSRGGEEPSESGYEQYRYGPGRRRIHHGSGGALGFAERLLETHTSSERAAITHIAACAEQLQRAQHNIELLSNDWRMGQMRLGGGSHPQGYLPVDTNHCSLQSYLYSLEAPPASRMYRYQPLLQGPPLLHTYDIPASDVHEIPYHPTPSVPHQKLIGSSSGNPAMSPIEMTSSNSRGDRGGWSKHQQSIAPPVAAVTSSISGGNTSGQGQKQNTDKLGRRQSENVSNPAAGLIMDNPEGQGGHFDMSGVMENVMASAGAAAAQAQGMFKEAAVVLLRGPAP
ncbi:hypothetical protein CEUSTIGMA_g2446.t1 [Chlamydomonas eustigma]|uniref:Uncharacterized protein n=1 Tax=Chlamydomonas eustigma TaxID=1157962 RepID=A0A250WWV3_9CHLO|nr:hypothetical protein CEUSTIGMA_g2446.t1 [Chlamydomonas eustigma]|eukprot:GAX75000.1 hypothetical protein CEUSTIGMA_g2446.t1 [Chlamydomonas eustigma]